MDDPVRRAWWDWAIAGAVATTTLLEVTLRDDLVWPPVALVVGLGLAVAVLIRRTRPLAAVAGGFGVFAVLDAATLVAGSAPVLLYSGLVVLLLAYSLFRWGSGRQAMVGAGFVAAAALAACVSEITAAGATQEGVVIEMVGGIAVLLFAAAAGVAMRYRAAARAQAIRQVRLQERAQLARELHDTVAHHVSAITIQAQAGLFLAQQSSLEGAVDALQAIEREASQTLAEMRTVVGALRDGEASPGPAQQHPIADLKRLASGTGAELRVEVALSGDLDDLPAATQAAVYRVAQESVTNARRHARAATQVTVEVTGDPDAVRLAVTDDGERTAPASGQPGYGLVGMTERVTVLGGTLAAGPRVDRGWSVTARLPRKGSRA